MVIPANYPLSPPCIKFLTPITHHPNVFSGGSICLDILKGQWYPTLSMPNLFQAMRSFLYSPNQGVVLDDEKVRQSVNQNAEKSNYIYEKIKKFLPASSASSASSSSFFSKIANYFSS